jgi:hypothetical protein
MEASDIRTIADIDKWRSEHKIYDARQKCYCHTSRYGAMVYLYGERNADKLMRNLEVAAWQMPRNLRA